jgi:hypothetical protein
MNKSVGRYVALKRAWWFPVALSLATCGAMSRAAETPIEPLKARITGAYQLEEWHTADGQTFRPPTVEGRFVVLDGSVTAIFTNRMKSPTETTFLAFGKYTLDSQKFAYAYDSTSIVTESPFWNQCFA